MLDSASLAEGIRLALDTNHQLLLKVYGSSMLPTLWPGVQVPLVRCSADQLEVGDIALCYISDRLVLHRAIHKKNNTWIVRGDAMPVEDAPMPHSAIIGRVRGIALGSKIWSTAPLWLTRIFNRACLNILPLSQGIISHRHLFLDAWRPVLALTRRALHSRSFTFETLGPQHFSELRSYLLRRAKLADSQQITIWYNLVSQGAVRAAFYKGRMVGTMIRHEQESHQCHVLPGYLSNPAFHLRAQR